MIFPTTGPTLPGPTNRFSGASQMWRLMQFFRDPIAMMRQQQAQFGPVSSLAGRQPAPPIDLVFALGPRYNQSVLSQIETFQSGAMFDVAHPSVQRLTTGVTFMNGVEHATTRRLLMPAFHRRYVARYRDDIVTLTEAMLAQWQLGTVVDVAHDMQQLAAQIAIKLLFGLDNAAYGQRLSYLIEQWMRLATAPSLRIVPLNIPGLPYHQFVRISKRLESALRDVIAEKRRNPDAGYDVLSLLMAARDDEGRALSDDELLGQMNVLFLAGHETSGNALAWTLFLLVQHPAVLRDVLGELERVLNGNAPQVEQLEALPLLDRAIKESLRLLPPVVWMQRVLPETACVGDYPVEKGTRLILSPFMTHHHPDVFEQPQRYLPERWANTEKPSLYEYLPFGAGARMCIGAALAKMELKLVLATILQRVQLQQVTGAVVDHRVTVTLQAAKGLPMRVAASGATLSKVPVTGTIHELVDLA